MNVTGCAVSSFVAWPAITEITGASLIAFTVKAKLEAAVNEPSDTVNVKFVTPFKSDAGVTVTVQAGLKPERLIFNTGTSVVFDEDTVIEVEQSRTLSTSEIENETGSATSSFVD